MRTVLYGFSIAYLFAPGTFDSASIVEVVSGLPDSAKYVGKALLAAPFAFHSINGLRHLSWDMGKCTPLQFLDDCDETNCTCSIVLSLKGAYMAGYVVLGATAASTVALVLM
jgi:succinate dehydrogenase (ubiquinone) cytochrome b560 subunit